MKNLNVYLTALMLATVANTAAQDTKSEVQAPNIKPIEQYGISALFAEDGTFQLEDGSIWQVAEKDREALSKWKVSAPLNFSISEGWVYSQQYIFTNKITGKALSASLYKVPEEYTSTANWIAYIEPSSGTLFLHNGAKFVLYTEDEEIYKEWKADDFILVGSYPAIFTPYKHMVFNYRTKKYAFAKLLKR